MADNDFEQGIRKMRRLRENYDDFINTLIIAVITETQDDQMKADMKWKDVYIGGSLGLPGTGNKGRGTKIQINRLKPLSQLDKEDEAPKPRYFQCPDCCNQVTVTPDMDAAKKMPPSQTDSVKIKLNCVNGCSVSFYRIRDRIPKEVTK